MEFIARLADTKNHVAARQPPQIGTISHMYELLRTEVVEQRQHREILGTSNTRASMQHSQQDGTAPIVQQDDPARLIHIKSSG